ncbi:lysine--tRNA ligase [Candidatus Roizmanbacteria bacterium]|nr:lysine--tRNA ligase [Candidatus Roizmanbacteria bacterium]
MATIDKFKQDRLDKLKKIRELGWNPYPSSFEKKTSVLDATKSEGKTVKTAGKLYSLRTHGNIAFADLKDETCKIQLFFKKDVLGKDAYKNLDLLDIGDYLGVEGTVTKTIAGEISIIPSTYSLLGKSLLPLPHEWFGVKDIEIRYRQRYLDLLMNQEVRERFNTRTKLIRYMRNYLDGLGFWEVETPVLQHIYGGANAKPFKTHLNALGCDMYLHIAVELYLKRLIAGGYERVYEITKNFRNEGVDHTHNPEFTMVEWYESYADYHRVMDVTEGLFKYLSQQLFGNTMMKVENKTVDIGGKWPRITMTEIIQKILNMNVEKETAESLLSFCKKEHIELIGGETKGQLIFTIFEHKVTDKLIDPTWIIDYPEDVSPLSKSHPTKSGWVERFEGYIGGKEICDGWSELTDPVVQRERFTKDNTVARKDKEEAQHIDEDYLTAMEYGMPPTGGIGIGIDRLTMFFTNTWAIKEVILFPTLKPENSKIKVVENVDKENKTETTIVSQSKLTLTRERALELLNEKIKNKNLVKHCLAVEATMKALAKKLGGDQNKWAMAGLLHDGDWEVTQTNPAKHAIQVVEWIKELGEQDPELVKTILVHNHHHNGEEKPSTPMEWALYTCDELTGLIVATTLVMPSKKIADVSVESVLKKFPAKSFAAGVNREQIKMCETELHIPIQEFVGIALKSMQSISTDLGL